MSALNTLKLVAAKKSVQTPTAVKRAKLVSKLQEQIDLVTARHEGRQHVAMRMQWTTDQATGARVAAQVNKRVREWFWTGDGGKLNAVIKYGAATLVLGKGGKNAIEVANFGELAVALATVKSAVAAGELDDAIADASVRTRKSFGK